ncbi:MAG: response regulator [Nitrospirae bacterium]|nr:MAG: response regulator [Nitrospirota bacterium]
MSSRILVVDDEPLILSSIERALERVGYDVVTVSDRKGFFSAMDGGGFSLVILDLHLNDLSMEEIISATKEKSPEAGFLVISGSDSVDDLPYIQKPFMIKELRARVKEILNERS